MTSPPITGTPTWQPSITPYRVETNNTFHLLMTVFTCGAWLPVWALVAIINSMRRRRVVTWTRR